MSDPIFHAQPASARPNSRPDSSAGMNQLIHVGNPNVWKSVPFISCGQTSTAFEDEIARGTCVRTDASRN